MFSESQSDRVVNLGDSKDGLFLLGILNNPTLNYLIGLSEMNRRKLIVLEMILFGSLEFFRVIKIIDLYVIAF